MLRIPPYAPVEHTTSTRICLRYVFHVFSVRLKSACSSRVVSLCVCTVALLWLQLLKLFHTLFILQIFNIQRLVAQINIERLIIASDVKRRSAVNRIV